MICFYCFAFKKIRFKSLIIRFPTQKFNFLIIPPGRTSHISLNPFWQSHAFPGPAELSHTGRCVYPIARTLGPAFQRLGLCIDTNRQNLKVDHTSIQTFAAPHVSNPIIVKPPIFVAVLWLSLKVIDILSLLQHKWPVTFVSGKGSVT